MNGHKNLPFQPFQKCLGNLKGSIFDPKNGCAELHSIQGKVVLGAAGAGNFFQPTRYRAPQI